jgi:hypothetical protein
MLVMELQDLMFTLLGFGPPLVWSFLLFTHSSLLEWECLFRTTVSCKSINFFLISQGFIAKSLLWVSEETLDLNSWKILKLEIWGIFGDGLNSFYNMRWPWAFGGQKWNLMVWRWNVP